MHVYIIFFHIAYTNIKYAMPHFYLAVVQNICLDWDTKEIIISKEYKWQLSFYGEKAGAATELEISNNLTFILFCFEDYLSLFPFASAYVSLP